MLPSPLTVQRQITGRGGTSPNCFIPVKYHCFAARYNKMICQRDKRAYGGPMSIAAAWVLTVMQGISPAQDTRENLSMLPDDRESFEEADQRYRGIAEAIAHNSRTNDQALQLIARSWLESGWARSIDLGLRRGQGLDTCVMQVRMPRDGSAWHELIDDRDKCFAAGARILWYSFEHCRKLPPPDRVALYLSGKCHSSEGRRASRKHYALVQKLRRKYE
jgi:hypothetical protein